MLYWFCRIFSPSVFEKEINWRISDHRQDHPRTCENKDRIEMSIETNWTSSKSVNQIEKKILNDMFFWINLKKSKRKRERDGLFVDRCMSSQSIIVDRILFFEFDEDIDVRGVASAISFSFDWRLISWWTRTNETIRWIWSPVDFLEKAPQFTCELLPLSLPVQRQRDSRELFKQFFASESDYHGNVDRL